MKTVTISAAALERAKSALQHRIVTLEMTAIPEAEKKRWKPSIIIDLRDNLHKDRLALVLIDHALQ